jgi:pyrroline-5-carboxylate reductase
MVPRARTRHDECATPGAPTGRAVYPDPMNLALLGGGKMGEALASGLVAGGWDPELLAIAEIDVERRRVLEEQLPGVRVVPSPAWAAADVDAVVVAVKPPDVADALRACAGTLPEQALVLSIAAGVTIADIEAVAGDRPVVRAMPNTGALVGKGAAAIAAGTHAGEPHLALAERVLGAVGTVVRVPETQLDAVTGLSGSGPAYVFLLAEAMTEAGVLVGLPRPAAAALVTQTLLGAATLLAETGDSPETLRAAVTSPGGTTAAGLHALEAHGMRAAVLDAVEAATNRSRQLGGGA